MQERTRKIDLGCIIIISRVLKWTFEVMADGIEWNDHMHQGLMVLTIEIVSAMEDLEKEREDMK